MSKLVMIHTDDFGNRTTVDRNLEDDTWSAFLPHYEDFLRACGFVIPWESLKLEYDSGKWNPSAEKDEKEEHF